MQKRIEEEERLNVTNDLIIKPSNSIYEKSKRQENIFIQNNQNHFIDLLEEKDPQMSLPPSSEKDTLENSKNSFNIYIYLYNIDIVIENGRQLDDEIEPVAELLTSSTLLDEEVTKIEQQVSQIHSTRKSVSSENSQPIQFRLPPIDSPSSLKKISTPAVPVMMVNPVLYKVTTARAQIS